MSRDDVLVYATASISDGRVIRARDLVARAMRAASSVLLLQTLAEFQCGNPQSENTDQGYPKDN